MRMRDAGREPKRGGGRGGRGSGGWVAGVCVTSSRSTTEIYITHMHVLYLTSWVRRGKIC